jgi:LCP family protein required for cell wall assembly
VGAHRRYRPDNKINSAYSVGGPGTLIETIDEYLGIPINHFVAVDFAGFQKVVTAIGGVEVYFPYPARDSGSGLDVPEAGCQLLDPGQALAYSRARYYENFRSTVAGARINRTTSGACVANRSSCAGR